MSSLNILIICMEKKLRFRLEVEEENERAEKAYKKAGFERLGYVQMAKDY